MAHKKSVKFWYFGSNNDFKCQHGIFILNWYFKCNIGSHFWLNKNLLYFPTEILNTF